MNTVLVINPGSTSTKVALFSDDGQVAVKTLRHSVDQLDQFEGVIDQLEFRRDVIQAFLKEYPSAIETLVAVVGRGGLLKPIPGGTFAVTEELLEDLRTEKFNSHASNLGGILANEIGKAHNVPAYVVDPVVVDELAPVARISGMKEIERRSVGHVLNQRAVARYILNKKNKDYLQSNVIVAHLGGGISIGAHQQGQIIEMINALDGEGPFTPERTGTLPLTDFAQYIIDHQLTLDQVKRLITKQGGMQSYLQDIDMKKIEKQAQNDDSVRLLVDAMGYQIAKGIGKLATVLKGKIDAIIVTGGIAHDDYLMNQIKESVDWIAPFTVYPGEREMEALYEGVQRVLEKSEDAKNYGDY